MLSFPVDHCKEAAGIRICVDNKKIVYSGDTWFSLSLIKHA